MTVSGEEDDNDDDDDDDTLTLPSDCMLLPGRKTVRGGAAARGCTQHQRQRQLLRRLVFVRTSNTRPAAKPRLRRFFWAPVCKAVPCR